MKSWAWLLLGLLAGSVSWSYMHRVLLPWEHHGNVERGRLRAEMGDLYPRWMGTRELLLNRQNPYGSEVSHKIQIGFYGHPIEQSYDRPPSEIVDEQRFVYPVYVVFLLAPTVHLDFAILQACAPLVLGVLTAISVWLWLGVLRWRPPPLVIAALALFVVSSPQIAHGLRLRQFGLFVAFLVAAAVWCLTRRQLFLAGVLLALATIKPQMLTLCLAWFLIWTLGDWKKRWPLATGFIAALGLLVGAGELLVPGWPQDFLSGVAAYRKYFPTTSPVRLILGDWTGGTVSIVAVLALLIYAWNRRQAAADSREFHQGLSLFLIASTLVLPLLTPYNQVLVLLPVLMLIRDWKTLPRWGRVGLTLLVAWPYLASVALLLHPPQLNSLHRMPLLPSALTIPFPFFVSLLTLTRSPKEA